ncbi:MAG: hypothetical protein R3E09_06500 [Novosphingobium sp.]
MSAVTEIGTFDKTSSRLRAVTTISPLSPTVFDTCDVPLSCAQALNGIADAISAHMSICLVIFGMFPSHPISNASVLRMGDATHWADSRQF